MPALQTPVGEHLREWRQRHRMSQLDLALEADISTRHLSFLETGLIALRTCPVPPASDWRPDDYGGVAVPLQMLTPRGLLSFLTTTTVFGTAVDITLTELTLETFFLADAATAAVLRGAA